ncbi:MAG: replication endonuclease [Burkholderiales bacterium]|nr:replication endonuclease [Burkholderiales bacterium]
MMAAAALPDATAFDLSDCDLNDAARRASASCQRICARWKNDETPEPTIRRILRNIARQHSIQLPNKASLLEVTNRLCDTAWWRRALRKRFRSVEHAAILAGRVHRHAGRYVSDHAMKRAIRDQQRVSELLASLVAINQATGEMLPLDELAKGSLANPANRRSALMARIKGIEAHAKAKGYEALFLTLTCPSRFHARHSSGQRNDRHDRTAPRQAQAYLNQVWRLAMRKLEHCGVPLCGLRVVEPHHDGCPHWHVLVFTPPEHCEQVIATFSAYALSESPNEPGAAEHRFVVEHIDPAKGSAVGYVAKYVSKSIDGEGVGTDHETGEAAASSASRIVAWARLWGIRQFQFFGVPPITPTRELFRLGSVGDESPGLLAAFAATKANDYGAWLMACEVFKLDFEVVYAERPSTRYRDEVARCIKGVKASACDLLSALLFTTRTDEWRIETKAKPQELEVLTPHPAPPWTRFNNCAPVDLQGFFVAPIEIEAPKSAPKKRDCYTHQAARPEDAFLAAHGPYRPGQSRIFYEAPAP